MAREITGVDIIDDAGKVCDRHGLINVGPTIAYEVAGVLLKLEARIAELKAANKKVFDDMWILLDAVAQEADDTLWYDGGTTAHERLCDIAAEYDAELGAELEKRLEGSC